MVGHSEEMSSDADKSQPKGTSPPSILTISLPNVVGSVLVPFSIFYDSGANNGRFDSSWNFTLPFIACLPQYFNGKNSDILILSGADGLAPELHEVLTDGEQE